MDESWMNIHELAMMVNLGGDSIRKGADLEKQNCLFGVQPAELGK